MFKLLSLILSCACFVSQAQVVFNNATSAFAAGVFTLTFSKTVAAGNNRLLYVGVGVEGQATPISSVTWNGRALTQFTVSNAASASSRGAIYYLALGSSASPTTANVVVVLGNNKDVSAGAADYSGVWQAAPIVNPTIVNGNDRFPTITFSSDFGHKAVCLMSSVAGAVTGTGAGQTTLWSIGGAFPSAGSHETGAPTVTMNYTIASSNKWIMIGGTIQDYAVMLPVELVSFDTRCSNNQITFLWETASERNSHYFMIEKSSDCKQWTSITKINASGNSQQTQHYNYEYASAENGPMYFRLKQYDFDGACKIFPTITSTCISSDNRNVTIFYNQSREELHLDFLNWPSLAEVSIYGAGGKLCFKETFEINNESVKNNIDIKLTEGIYTAVICDPLGKKVSKSFAVMRP